MAENRKKAKAVSQCVTQCFRQDGSGLMWLAFVNIITVFLITVVLARVQRENTRDTDTAEMSKLPCVAVRECVAERGDICKSVEIRVAR